MEDLTRSTIVFIQQHQAWAVPIVFVLAFCESFAFVSLLVPATGILLGIGGLIAAADIGFWPMWLAAALGAFVGDLLAFWLALHFKDRVLQIRLLATRPDLVMRGVEFFKRQGIIAVFVGRISRCGAAHRRRQCNAVVAFSDRQCCIGSRLGGRYPVAGLCQRSLADGVMLFYPEPRYTACAREADETCHQVC